jgi:hypothetical protein
VPQLRLAISQRHRGQHGGWLDGAIQKGLLIGGMYAIDKETDVLREDSILTQSLMLRSG